MNKGVIVAKENNVLFLDDEESILSSLRRLFINEPYGIVTTTDYKEAMEIIEREKIKVVLSDHRMPEIRGTDFLHKVKEKYPHTIRILFTGFAEFSAAEDAINVGEVFRFISKPWDSNELKMIVNQAIQQFDIIKQNKELFDMTHIKNEELESLNRKLKNMYEVQKEFTSTVSHELRTPLASIKSTVDLVLSETTGKLNEEQTKFLNKAKNNVDRLSRLINDILDLTKMESGKAEFNISLNDIGEVINDVMETQESIAKEKGLFLKTEIPPGGLKVLFDVDKMHQVFNNLMSNAIKFTEKGGIKISCINRHEENHVEIWVQDTGLGIKEEDVGKLFRKFQQLGDARNHVGGTGLGLAICKEIISRHGGKIWVESEGEKGTCFKFILLIEDRRGR